MYYKLLIDMYYNMYYRARGGLLAYPHTITLITLAWLRFQYGYVSWMYRLSWSSMLAACKGRSSVGISWREGGQGKWANACNVFDGTGREDSERDRQTGCQGAAAAALMGTREETQGKLERHSLRGPGYQG